MSVTPIITFKAGICDADYSSTPPKIRPKSQPGFLYLYNEEELVHFCWRPRNESLANPTLDLVMVPTDGTFRPYLGQAKIANKSPVNGRVFVLKFSSSSQRHFFWLQSREQPPGEPSQFSPRDLRLGQIVDNLLQGNDVDATSELETLRQQPPSGGDDDDTMEDAPPEDLDRTVSGGAGADATGGDVREEGEESREGGADGGRADTNMTAEGNDALQNFLASLQGSNLTGAPQRQQLFTSLTELLSGSVTVPMIEQMEPSAIEDLLVNHVPSSLIFLEYQTDAPADELADPQAVRVAVRGLELEQQKKLLRRVLRSPQFTQGSSVLTAALRDGGLPTICEALGVEVRNGGYTGPDRTTPLTGGEAVEAFMEGIRKAAEKNNSRSQ